MRTCPSCKEKVAAYQKFCGYCGAAVDTSAPEAAGTAGTPPAQPAAQGASPATTGGVSRSPVVIITALVIVIAGILLVMSAISGPGSPAPPPILSGTPARTVSPTSTLSGLLPGPVETMPSNSRVYLIVSPKSSYDAKMTVRLDGGPGIGVVKDIEARALHPDGSLAIAHMDMKSLDPQPEMMVQGTKETDHLQVIVTLYSGKQYLVIDQLVPYQQRF